MQINLIKFGCVTGSYIFLLILYVKEVLTQFRIQNGLRRLRHKVNICETIYEIHHQSFFFYSIIMCHHMYILKNKEK